MRRRTKDKVKTLTCMFYDLFKAGYLISLTGLLSQGRTADKLLKGFVEYSDWRIKQALREQKLKGYIEYDENDENSPIILTSKGFIRQTKQKLKEANFGKWDHLWRLVLFDIPEYGRLRQRFRRFLQNAGCYRIQKSVYAYPYDCKKEILSIASNFQVASYVDIYTVPNLGRQEKSVRDFFLQRATIKK